MLKTEANAKTARWYVRCEVSLPSVCVHFYLPSSVFRFLQANKSIITTNTKQTKINDKYGKNSSSNNNLCHSKYKTIRLKAYMEWNETDPCTAFFFPRLHLIRYAFYSLRIYLSVRTWLILNLEQLILIFSCVMCTSIIWPRFHFPFSFYCTPFVGVFSLFRFLFHFFFLFLVCS